MENDFKVINNGVKITDECQCIWCKSVMKRGGVTYMGSGVNSFTLWCTKCGAIVHHAHDYNRKISGIDIKYNFNE